ncbi:MAG TPA: GNAT family N-acetyltransferase [Jatrophihabitantaceae bacterium]|nr:GNAT family N-acetyltransferase [Jatrophihabitantaceae bacterium]
MVALEPWGRQHLAAMDAVLSDPDVLRFTRVPVPVPDGFATTWLARYEDGRKDGVRDAFAIVDEHSHEFLGLALAPRLDAEERTAELGYLVLASARGRGVASAALQALTEWAFGKGMQRIELLISVDNAGSKRVAQRCGYVFEGVLRSTYLKQGRREDIEMWSRLPTDP